MESDAARRKQILWTIERKLAEDVARPIILYDRFATCWQPYLKGPTIMVDSIFNSNRREDWCSTNSRRKLRDVDDVASD